MSSTNTAIIQLIESLGVSDRDAILKAFKKSPSKKTPVVRREAKKKSDSTVWAEWTSHILKEHPPSSPEYKTWLTTRIQDANDGKLLYNAKMSNVQNGKNVVGELRNIKDARRGAHVAFPGFWRDTHPEEYDEFKKEAAFNAAVSAVY